MKQQRVFIFLKPPTRLILDKFRNFREVLNLSRRYGIKLKPEPALYRQQTQVKSGVVDATDHQQQERFGNLPPGNKNFKMQR